MPTRFSQLLCADPAVKTAFTCCPPIRAWWRIVLWLHGKPTTPNMMGAERVSRVADGFRFYAGLYRSLSAVFSASAVALVAVARLAPSTGLTCGSIACGAAAIYLWCAGGLGYAGAAQYANGDPAARTSLVAFMAMIVGFLSLFVASVSVIVTGACGVSAALSSLLAASALYCFGIGSYMVEIVYLVGSGNRDNGMRTATICFECQHIRTARRTDVHD